MPNTGYPICPKCKIVHVRPSKLELERWVCKNCNEIFEDKRVRNIKTLEDF